MKSYKDAEEAKRKETIEQFVDNAIAEGKINSDAKKIIGISNSKLDRDYELIFEEDGLDDVYLCPAYIIIGQIIALVTSLRVGNTPDNPSRTHTVNRVVKGVTIHDYKN